MTDLTARRIHKLYATGEHRQADVALRFGCAGSAVSCAVTSDPAYQRRYSSPRKGKRPRVSAAELRRARKRGYTLREIGSWFGVTRQAVHEWIGTKRGIRKLYASGKHRQADLALRFGCTAAAVSRAVTSDPEYRRRYITRKGSRNGKLSSVSVAELRQARERGHTLEEIGSWFGVTGQAVSWWIKAEEGRRDRRPVAPCL